jgi:hypothetical protein
MASQPVFNPQQAGFCPDEFEALLQWAAASMAWRRKKALAIQSEAIMNFTQVGETAGAIWQALSTSGPLTMARTGLINASRGS